MPALASPNFTIGCTIFLHYLLFSVMADKGYLMVWELLILRLSVLSSV